MKTRRNFIIIAVSFAVILVAFAIIMLTRSYKFALSSEYYGSAEVQDININELQSLIDGQKSFGLFISQPTCQASADLEKNLDVFLEAYPLKFYEISFSTIKDDNIIPDLKFYPSFAIFHNGRVVDFLEADSDEDAAAYTSVDGFKDWFSGYVELSI